MSSTLGADGYGTLWTCGSATAAATLRRLDPHAAVDDWFDVKTLDELRAAEPALAATYDGSWRTKTRVRPPLVHGPREMGGDPSLDFYLPQHRVSGQ